MLTMLEMEELSPDSGSGILVVDLGWGHVDLDWGHVDLGWGLVDVRDVTGDLARSDRNHGVW